ncbi:UPF0182 family protein [Candidatus Woesearchaeota archaeon]|nr:UPF0182 family protein [Candidatus Woesearchaeota archaeon]
MRNIRNKITAALFLAVFIAIMSFSSIARLITDYQWFENLGFEQIFLISLRTKVLLFFAAALLFFAFAAANLFVSSKTAKSEISLKLKLLIAAVVSFFVGTAAIQKWFAYLQYAWQVPFGVVEPIFSRDAAFYVFSLPFMLAAWRFLLAIVILTLILVTLDYLQNFLKELFMQKRDVSQSEIPMKGIRLPKIKQAALIHMSVLGSLVFILLAVRHYLERYLIMYSEKGIVVGAGYTDVVAYLPILKFLMVFALIVAALFYAWIFFTRKLRKRHILFGGIILYLTAFLFAPTIIPGIVQALKVSPNELNLEEPYIANNIEFTNKAYGLDEVERRDFSVERNLSADILAEEKTTLENVRLLDWRPLTQTYKQTQEIRLYYDLSGIDIDRYDIGGKYTEVMLSPREMNQRQLAENAKTWVNEHLVYTHGYGVVMSPVNKVTEEGLPTFYIKNIPPEYEADGNLKIDRPQVYYGEKGNEYVIVNTKQREFDYPKGSTNEYIHYDAEGGVQLDSFWKKLLMTIRFFDIKILLSSDITAESRIMFNRNVQDRIAKITPFLRLDNDPYIVINEGRLYWVQDAYTVTGNYPYSEKRMGINYIRNSVKVVVDAYTGSVTYYVVDIDDPLIRTYARIFPNEFKSFDSMPAGLKQHIRYPEDLFRIQSSIYTTYHMDDVTVFYNKEDAWEPTKEIYGTGQKIEVEPYYIIIELPEKESAEFVLMRTFTPLRKDNMIAWLAARCDGESYGKLLLYKFPKEKLVYGSLQIEAKFDQDSEISQQLTLWSQRGSSVTRGNLLVIPVRNSILYIEPLYLQAEQGQLPQMKRVLISDGEKVVMEESLGAALEELFGRKTADEDESVLSEDLIADANRYYDEILGAMRQNDWNAFGSSFDKLGQALEKLGQE